MINEEMEKEIDELYEKLKISIVDDVRGDKLFDTDAKRTNDFFEKRWDSSFFANAIRY